MGWGVCPRAPHQKAVGVDPVRGTGDQCAEVPLRVGPQGIGLEGEDGFDLIHRIRDGLITDGDGKGIAGAQFVQVGEEFGPGQSCVSHQHRMVPCAADGEGALGQVTHAFLQRHRTRAVVDGQFQIQCGDRQIAHHSPVEV